MRQEPRDDLLSKLLEEKVKDRKLTSEELNSIGFLLFLAGLDTVANTLSFTFNHLAQDPELQARLAAHPNIIPTFVEEALRRFSIVQQPRLCKKDIELQGAQIRAGEMIVCSLPLAGMDERVLEDWEEGRARGVVGSPHFFVGCAGFFCPSLTITHVDGKLQIVSDPAAFDGFLDECFTA